MLRLHVEFLSHLVAVISPEILVERLVIASDRATYRGGVGSEYGADGWYLVLDIESAETCHPLVGMIYYLLILQLQEVIHRLYNQTSRIREHARLVVVAVRVERVHLEILPKFCVYSVFLCVIRLKINQNRDRLSRNVPTTHLNLYALLLSHLLPIGKQGVVLLEIRRLLFAPTVRTYEYQVVLYIVMQCFSSC